MSCRHLWHQLKADKISVVNGLRTTRYYHVCPKCGRTKETLRTDRSMPPPIKWKRELEKVVQRAASAGYTVLYQTLVLDLNKVLVVPIVPPYEQKS